MKIGVKQRLNIHCIDKYDFCKLKLYDSFLVFLHIIHFEYNIE